MKIKSFLKAGVGVALISAVAIPMYSADAYKTDINVSDKGLGPLERANKLIGKTINTSDNQKAGKLENLVVDLESGRILFAVIGTGVLGVGGHDYAVTPAVFADATGENLRLNVDKAKLTGAPEFSSNVDKPEQLAQASFVNQVYQYFGQPAWWQGSTATADSGTFHNVHKAKDAIGMKVKNVNNEDLGKVEDLMVNLSAGRIAYAVLDPDNSLNLGKNLYALPPNMLTWNSDQKTLTADLTRDKLESAPHFAKDQWQMISEPAYATKVYQYHGKQAWFESGATLKPTGKDTKRDYQNK